MSINALGTESPSMKRRWANIGLLSRPSQPSVSPVAGREQSTRPPSGLLIANYRTKNNLVVAESQTMVLAERIVISSYVETPALLPTLERTLSEVEELSDDDSDDDSSSSQEDSGGMFSSPRPAQPPEHAPKTRASKGSSAFLPREIMIREDIVEEPQSEPFVLKQKIQKRQNDRDIIVSDKTCRACDIKGNDRRRGPKRRRGKSNTNALEIIFAVILAIITLVMEPTTTDAPIHIPSSNTTLRQFNESSSLAIERMRHSNDILIAPATTSNELSRKTCERLLCKLLVKLRRKSQGLMKKVRVKDRMDQTKQKINTVASSVGASTLATLGAKIGSKVDSRFAPAKIGAATSAAFAAKIQTILSRILPTFVTIGTAVGASIGAALGIKVADVVLTHLAKARLYDVREATTSAEVASL